MSNEIDATNMESKDRARHALDNWFPNWSPNIEVTVWGKAKATLVNKSQCLDSNLSGGQRYAGDCDECSYFCGIRGVSKAEWGDQLKGCCGLLIDAAKDDT